MTYCETFCSKFVPQMTIEEKASTLTNRVLPAKKALSGDGKHYKSTLLLFLSEEKRADKTYLRRLDQIFSAGIVSEATIEVLEDVESIIKKHLSKHTR